MYLLNKPEGQIYVYTAPFRGSFSGVYSKALRIAGLGSHVLISQFLKGGVDQGVERSLLLCGRLEWMRPSFTGYLDELSFKLPERGILATQAVQEVWNYTKEQLLQGGLDQLVLDELGLAISWGYLDKQEVLTAVRSRVGRMDIILTGPLVPIELMVMADRVKQSSRKP
ncbi:MAG TPA: cob(I)yrinic acid a,c-diamide adenosyltransferase [Prochlorococcaceae cyanobacterium AMR_MDS_5431]|nr:cob(I)yrinic acid a,c-diamide adenosyltransferase [Prochlorococcaceae cyanobacterium AMR_MDS_5431]